MLGGLCMRVVVQRVKHASVTINGTVNGKINNGFLVLLGVQSTDSEQDVDYLVKKVTNLRIFSDENDKMNLSLKDVNGELLIVSQFTLYANCKEGNRPSFVEAAKPDIAIPLYEYFVSECKKIIPVVETGIFGADMKVDLLNDGPVTIIMDSK
jgi:D-tyrosyl-tRNA(Tyr) deacylase